MSNHPNRSASSDTSNPTPEDVKSARATAQLTQAEAAALVYSTLSAWQRWEQGERRMHPAIFELFKIKSKQH